MPTTGTTVDIPVALRGSARPSWLIAALVFVLLLALGAGLLVRFDAEQQRRQREAAAQLASERAQVVQRNVERMLASNHALAALVHQGNGQVIHFEAAAGQLLDSSLRVQALSLSPDGVVRHVFPSAGNESLIGFDQLRDPGQQREAVFTRDTDRLTLAGPLQLAQGGPGVVSRLPIFLPDADGQRRFWGFSNVTIRLPDLLGGVGLDGLRRRGYHYRLWRVLPDSGAQQIISASQSEPLVEPVRQSLEVPNGAWNLDLAPVDGWNRDAARARGAAVVVLVSLLLAYLAQLQLEQRRHKAGLERLMRERTAQMLATQNQLRSTVEAIRDPIFEIDLSGRYHSCYAPADSLLPIPAEHYAGRTVFEVLSPAAAEVTMEALRSARIDGFSQGEQYALELAQGTRWYELSVARKQVGDGEVPRFIVMARDITGRKTAKSRIRRLAFYDPLTDLPNRRLLQDRLEHALTATDRSRHVGALLLIDLDNFKALNDTWGHDKGDLLLKQVALRLRGCVRDVDTVARLGGDEFVVLIDDAGPAVPEAIANTRRVAEKVLAQLGAPYQIAGREHRSGTSIGVSLFGVETTTLEDVLKRSDVAMYQAKAAGRNTVRFFDPAMQAAVEARAAMEIDLRQSLTHDALELHFQPQVGPGNRVFGAEALLRWTHPERGPVSPAAFIPVAEQSGLIVELGEWVLRRACAQLAAWAMSPHTAALTLAINVSVHQFRQAGFVDTVRQALGLHGVDPSRLKLEITESMFASDQEAIINTMLQIKTLGVGFSLDDFGTGYSSLSYLRRLPLDQLKIDQSFVREVLTDPNDAAIARTVIALGQSLGLAVIAEGVESQGQREFLAAHGCDHCQGYLISRPVPIAQFDAFVAHSMGDVPA
jgi:diguanylate cyclase (GGDEF)-like protein/PAS domain S-box-containing protein